MINKKENRLRRAGATRARIKLQKVNRLTVHRTNLHIYASIISASGDRVLVSASTAEAEVRAMVNGNGGNIAAAKIVGARLAEKAKAAGIESCAFDRSGYRYHGRVAALAEAARVLRPGGRLCVWDCAFDRAYPEPFSVNLTIDLDGEILHTTYGICKLDGQSMAQIADICRALSLRPLRAEESSAHFYLEFEKDETVSKGTQKVGDLF